MEAWQSGLMRPLAKGVGTSVPRRFESSRFREGNMAERPIAAVLKTV